MLKFTFTDLGSATATMNSVSHTRNWAVLPTLKNLSSPLDRQILPNFLIPFEIYFQKNGGFTPFILSYWYYRT